LNAGDTKLAVVDDELQRMQQLNEYDFTFQHVIPMFKEIGYGDVRYTGGNAEHGRDVTFYDFDRFGNRQDIAAQVKIGDIGGVNIIRTVINEAIAAFENPFIDQYTHEEKRIHTLYVVTSGEITGYAMTEIKNGLTHYPTIHFMDGKRVLSERRTASTKYLEYSRAEVLMKNSGLADLLSNPTFVDSAEELLLVLVNDKGETELETINDLPNLLCGLSSVREKVQQLDLPTRSCILHWFSIRLVTKAWYIYGKKKAFGLKEDTTS
jgi:hypothetical protein